MMINIANLPSQKGRIAIVTGANAGLGFETAKVLADKEATVILACRSEEKARHAMRAIEAGGAQGRLDFIALDLADLQSVRDFAAQFLAKYQQLDLLINNAGVMMPPYTKTKDGFELQMGANYLSHFLLTSLLLPTLEQTPNARIVQLSSIAHRAGRIQFDDLHFEKNYSRWQAYSQSKLAMLMFAFELDRRLKTQGYKTLSVAAHPGVSKTSLIRHMPKALVSITETFFGWLFQPATQGAVPQLYAALGDDISGGDFTGPSGFRQMRGPVKKVQGRPHAYDEDVANRLWLTSENLTGARFFA